MAKTVTAPAPTRGAKQAVSPPPPMPGAKPPPPKAPIQALVSVGGKPVPPAANGGAQRPALPSTAAPQAQGIPADIQAKLRGLENELKAQTEQLAKLRAAHNPETAVADLYPAHWPRLLPPGDWREPHVRYCAEHGPITIWSYRQLQEDEGGLRAGDFSPMHHPVPMPAYLSVPLDGDLPQTGSPARDKGEGANWRAIGLIRCSSGLNEAGTATTVHVYLDAADLARLAYVEGQAPPAPENENEEEEEEGGDRGAWLARAIASGELPAGTELSEDGTWAYHPVHAPNWDSPAKLVETWEAYQRQSAAIAAPPTLPRKAPGRPAGSKNKR